MTSEISIRCKFAQTMFRIKLKTIKHYLTFTSEKINHTHEFDKVFKSP